MRNILNGSKVFCDVLASSSISSRSTGVKYFFLINNIYGRTVKLWFDNIFKIFNFTIICLFQISTGTSLKRSDFLLIHGVLKTAHGRIVNKFTEAFKRLGTHTLCRRIWRHKRRIVRFE